MRKHSLLLAITLTSCGQKLEGPSPELTGVTAPTPAVVCNAQLITPVVVAGEGLAPLVQEALTDPNAVLPAVTVVHSDGTRTTVPDQVGHEHVTWQSQEQLTFEVEEDLGLAPGVYDIEVCNRRDRKNRDEAAVDDDLPSGDCITSEDVLLVVPPPVLTATIPDMVCTEDGTNTITLQGTDFLIVHKTLPEVLVGVNAAEKGAPTFTCEAPGCKTYLAETATMDGGACEELVFGVQKCTTLTFTVPQADLEPITELLASATYSVSVRNPAPADCESLPAAETDLTAVPPPTVSANLSPDIICTADGNNIITVAGADFLSINDGTTTLLPTVNLTSGATTVAILADAVSGTCVPVSGPNDTVQACDTLTFTVAQAGLTEGNWAVTVTNPVHPVATTLTPCTSNTAFNLTVVPPPDLNTIQPDLLCSADGTTAVTITAALTGGYGGFLNVDGALPSVLVGATTFVADGVSGTCATLPGPPVLTETVTQCDTLTFTVPAAFVAGVHNVTVTNPIATGCGIDCSACVSDALTLVVRDRPAITAVTPPISCPGQVPAQLVLTGTFTVVDMVNPTVTFGGNPATVASAGGCTPVAMGAITEDVDACTSLTINVPSPGTLTPGDYSIIVTDPAPLGCASMGNTCGGFPCVFTVEDPPTITAIAPDRVCEDIPETFTITGTNFRGMMLTSVAVDPTPGSPGDEIAGTVVSVVPAGTSMTVDFAGLNPGTYDVIVSNDGNPDGMGCDATLPASLTVEPTPFVFFVDPPVAYNGINTQVTVFVTNINCDPDPPGVLPDDCIAFLGISPAGSGLPPVALSQVTYDLGKPKRVLGIVDGATTAAGSYDVFLTDGLGCMAVLPNGLQVTDTLGPVSLTAIDPTFGWTGGSTAATVSGTGFVATPRLYLNPTFGGPGAVASALSAVAFVDATRLTAIVPAALTPGQYELIVVNPDGTVDVSLPDFSFTVTADPPPVVTNITPGSIPKADGEVVTIAGANFCPPAASVTVGMTCRDAAGGAFITFAPAVNACNASDITITVDAATAGLADGSVCVVRVTNDTNQSFGEFSAMSVTNPSGNPTTFTDRASLNVARRAPGTTAGRVTNAARYVYVIGGDDGATANAFDSIETGAVDAFGALPSGWELRDPLPAGNNRTLAGAVNLGRFIYVVGGNDGTTAVDTVLRAEILDPLRAPQINDLDFTPPPVGVGMLGPGTWNYKVSALFPMGDPNNPGGESLPSDVQPVTVPDLPGVELILFWTPVPGASGYRVYRSPLPNQATGTEELIADNVAGATFTDLGAVSIMPVETPSRNGDLGQWSTVATMSTAREGAGVALAEDPATPGTFYLYAVGGQDTTPAALASYEYLDIVVDAGPGPTTGDQMVGAFTTGAVDMPTARWQLGLYSVNNARASRVAGTTTLLYAVGGRATGAGGVVNEIRVAEVTAGGELGPCTNGAGCGTTWADPGPTTARAGFGAVANHNTLYAFCGANGTPDGSADSGEICGVGQTCAGGLPDPPDLVNFNSTGAIGLQARYLLGTAVESATIFLIGGDGGAGAIATTESMPW